MHVIVVLMKIYCWNKFWFCSYRKRAICTEQDIRCIYRKTEPDPFWKRKQLKKKIDQIIHSHTKQNISRNRILALVEGGFTNKEIGRICEVSQLVVANWIHKFKIKRSKDESSKYKYTKEM